MCHHRQTPVNCWRFCSVAAGISIACLSASGPGQDGNLANLDKPTTGHAGTVQGSNSAEVVAVIWSELPRLFPSGGGPPAKLQSIEAQITSHNRFVSLNDVASIAITARIESVIAKRIAKELMSGRLTGRDALVLRQKLVESPLDPSTLANALGIRLEKEKAAVVADPTMRVAAFKALFESVSDEVSMDVMKEMATDSAENWVLAGKFPYENLCEAVEAKVRLVALDALLRFVQRGGRLDQPRDRLEAELKSLTPESFRPETLLTYVGWIRVSYLRPSDVIELFE